MKLILTALTLLFTSQISVAQAEQCIPIGFDNNARIQAVMKSDLVTELDPLSAYEFTEERFPSASLTSVIINQQGSLVVLTYKITAANPAESFEASFPFAVKQTCDGKLKVTPGRWGTPAR